MARVCNTCGKKKELDHFYAKRAKCKSCLIAQSEARRKLIASVPYEDKERFRCEQTRELGGVPPIHLKRCGRCEAVKEIDLFPKRRSSRDGHYENCSECVKLANLRNIEKNKNKSYEDKELARLKNTIKFVGSFNGTHYKRCQVCREIKDLGSFSYGALWPDGHQRICKACVDEADPYYLAKRRDLPYEEKEDYREKQTASLAEEYDEPFEGHLKRCTTCETIRPISDFHHLSSSRDGHSGSCKDCRTQRSVNPVAAFKNRCYKRYRRALERGKITRATHCEQCGRSDKVQGHHRDYSKPLDVDWLCTGCHKAWHSEHEFKLVIVDADTDIEKLKSEYVSLSLIEEDDSGDRYLLACSKIHR